MKIILMLMGFFGLYAGLAYSTESTGMLRNLEVSGVSDYPAVVSGYALSWVRVDFKVPNGATLPIYAIYLSENQRMPAVGDHCDVQFRVGKVRGNVGTSWTDLSQAKIANYFSCRYKIDARR